MTRPVDVRFPVMPALHERWSPRSFDDREPESQKLGSIFEAVRLAPSAHNSQPTRFMIGRKGRGEMFDRLFDCLDPHNQEWAHRAPTLILGSVARRRFSQVSGEFVEYPHCLHDLGLAVMSLIVQAQYVGLHCHPMAAFDCEKAQVELNIPQLYLPAIMIALGYPGDPAVLPLPLQQREVAPRTRRSLEEIVFEHAWGQASSLLRDT